MNNELEKLVDEIVAMTEGGSAGSWIEDNARIRAILRTAYTTGLEVERERFKRILNDHRYKKLEVDTIFRCMLLDIDDDYKDDSQASSAIKEEINKSKV